MLQCSHITTPRSQTTLQTDASAKGLGSCLLQDDKSEYFASKALTDAQKGYLAIELESIAVAWEMEKFHHFLYASPFLLETGQKLLEAILSKSINQATPRLQRVLFRNFAYHFTVKHIPGNTNQLADCLSQLGGQKDIPKSSTSLGQEISVHPWSKLATDIFHFEGGSYLLIVDYTSRFLIVYKLTSLTAVHVANQCKLVFSEYDTLISENSPCYILQAFTSVMQAFSVNHVTSSPHYLQSNGLAEKYIQIVKCLFNKAKEEGKDLYKCLMIYCNTPLQVACRSDLPMSNAVKNNLEYNLKCLGTLTSMKCYLHMIYM